MNCQLTKTKPFFLKKSSSLTLNRSGKLEQKRRAAHRRRRTEAAQRCQSFKKAKVAGAKKASGSAAGEEEQKQQQRAARRQMRALGCAVASRSLVLTGSQLQPDDDTIESSSAQQCMSQQRCAARRQVRVLDRAQRAGASRRVSSCACVPAGAQADATHKAAGVVGFVCAQRGWFRLA